RRGGFGLGGRFGRRGFRSSRRGRESVGNRQSSRSTGFELASGREKLRRVRGERAGNGARKRVGRRGSSGRRAEQDDRRESEEGSCSPQAHRGLTGEWGKKSSDSGQQRTAGGGQRELDAARPLFFQAKQRTGVSPRIACALDGEIVAAILPLDPHARGDPPDRGMVE